MKFTYILLLLSFLINFNEATGQNGWVRKSKEFYTQIAISNFSSNDYYNTSGKLSNAGSTFNSRGLFLFGEYGITNKLTAVVDAPLLMLNNFNTTETVAGIGSIKLGLKYGLLKAIPVAIQVDFDIPTDDGVNLSNAKEPNSLGITDQINLPTSDGEFNIWTTLVVSQSINNGKTFGSLYGKVNFRTESFSHQWQTGLEIGHLFFDKFYLIGKLSVQEQLFKKENTVASFLYGEGTTFTSAGVTAMYKMNDHWKLIAGYSDFFDTIAKRRNIYDGATFTIGVSVEY